MSEHSYGHGQHCYWCGADGDTEDGKPCDESVNKRPTPEQMQHYNCTSAIEDARYELEQAERTCETHGYRDAAKEVYECRLRLSDALRRLEAIGPSEHKSNEREEKHGT